MHGLQHSVKALLLTDDVVLQEFQERFTLTPLSLNTAGYSRGNQTYTHSQATFQIEGNGQVGTVRAVETPDGVKDLEVYVGQKVIVVNMNTDLANITRAFILADDSLQRLFGNNVRLTQLTRGDNLTTNINGQDMTETFASFEVKGSKRIGVASVAASQYHATEFVLYVNDETFRIQPCQRALKSFCYSKGTERFGNLFLRV